jgi:hypothetical protein
LFAICGEIGAIRVKRRAGTTGTTRGAGAVESPLNHAADSRVA